MYKLYESKVFYFLESSFIFPAKAVNYLVVVVQLLTHVQFFETPWTVAFQAPLSKGFLRQEYWTGVLFLTPGDLPDPETEPMSTALVGGFFFYYYF